MTTKLDPMNPPEKALPYCRKWIYGAIRHINKNVDDDAFLFCEDPACRVADLGDEDNDGDDYEHNSPNVRMSDGKAVVDLLTNAPVTAQRVQHALTIAYSCGQVYKNEQKAWVIDQMVRALTGPDYDKWVREFNEPTNGDPSNLWETGVAP